MIKFQQILSTMIGLAIAMAILFFTLSKTNINIGTLIDWVIGFSISSWLLAITTIPWNIYFEAKTVLNQAKTSRKKNIAIDEKELTYVSKVQRNAILTAITLHIVSAIALYLVAYFQISILGYYGAIASILLTLLRPLVSFYHYISQRLSNITKEVQYPRNDVVEINNKLLIIEQNLNLVLQKLNTDDKDSWISKQNNTNKITKVRFQEILDSIVALEKDLKEENIKAVKDTKDAISQVNKDAKFVENLVEIVRFIKKV